MKALFTTILLLSGIAAWAQQDPHYTFFPFNQQYVNPAYVGSRNTATFMGLHRSQWLGFEGAPSSQILSFATPVMQQRAGLGGMINRYTIGIQENWRGTAAYSYNIRLTQELDLRLGLQASLEYMGIDFEDPRVVTIIQNDPAIAESRFADEYAANVGVGLFFKYKDIFYFGASSPKLYANEVGFDPTSLVTAEVSPHRYITAGATIALNETLDLMPNVLLKQVDGAPLDAEMNVNFRYNKLVTAGLTYRAGGNGSGDSVDFMAFFQASPKVGAGIAYDLTLSDVREYQSGSIEVMLRYDLRDEKVNLENPRYFKKK